MHFVEYSETLPGRIPSLATRLGVSPDDFAVTLKGFENFTDQAMHVRANGLVRENAALNKQAFFIEGAQKPKKGVIVIVQDGKLQSMMPGSPQDFNKLKL